MSKLRKEGPVGWPSAMADTVGACVWQQATRAQPARPECVITGSSIMTRLAQAEHTLGVGGGGVKEKEREERERGLESGADIGRDIIVERKKVSSTKSASKISFKIGYYGHNSCRELWNR